MVIGRVLTDWAVANELDPIALIAASHSRRTIDVVRDFAKAGTDCEAEAAGIEAAEAADVCGIVAIPGAADLLSRLPPSRWAIVTSAGRELAVRRLAAAGLTVPEVLVTAEDIEHGKPDPSVSSWLRKSSERKPNNAWSSKTHLPVSKRD